MERPRTPFLRFLLEASVHLDGARDADKALRRALTIVREAFDAEEACLAVPVFGERRPKIYASSSPAITWNKEPFSDFLAGRRPRLGATRMYAAIERRGRTWGVLALRNVEKRFDLDALKDMARVGTHLSRIIERIDRTRIAEVRARIDRKMMEQLRPLDLFYQVLHGLRTLTHYDHSAALLIQTGEGRLFEVVAEQVSWRKGPSRRIDRKLELDEGAERLLRRGEILGLDRRRGAWAEWKGRADAVPLAALAEGEGDEGQALSVLVAPFTTRGESTPHERIGALVVAARSPGSLGRYEAELVQRFLPVAVVAIRNLERATSLEAGVLEAESRNALATLARGVSHDVNNAIGAVVPRLQQMEVDVREGHIVRDVFLQDLADIRAAIDVCRRIFGGLLSYSRNAAVTSGLGSVSKALADMRAVLSESLERRGIELVIEAPEDPPLLHCSQTDLDQLILNLASNARDAMPTGGRLAIHVGQEGSKLILTLSDTGVGIPAKDLPRVKEPFFTTKKHGNGLGLSICRAILWRMRGEMKVTSEEGRGTSVRIVLPAKHNDRGGSEPSTWGAGL